MIAVLHLNTAELRRRLANEGFMLCKCSEDTKSNCLSFTDFGFYDIHGEDMSHDDRTQDFGTDVEAFIAACKEVKKAWAAMRELAAHGYRVE